MPLKTPSFWYKKLSWQAIALSPLSLLYGLGHKINVKRQTPYRSYIPVICVGNIVMGGSGKTPTTLALFNLVKDHEIAKKPVILTRGYGGNVKEPILVNPSKHNYHDVGDEALMMAKHARVIVSPNRAQGAQYAEDIGVDLILMDDGFQNNTLYKDISLLVIDSHNPFGNGLVCPAGPLREFKSSALKHCDAIISLNGNAAINKPLFTAIITPNSDKLDKDQSYVAFAGLGRPEKFKTTLEYLGLKLSCWHTFADHHPYTKEDLEHLDAHAVQHDAKLLTTEKDHVRLPEPYPLTTQTLPITLSFDDPQALSAFIKERVA